MTMSLNAFHWLTVLLLFLILLAVIFGPRFRP